MPHLRRNLELKARCSDLATARQRALGLGAKPAGLLIQCDTYFHVPTGRLKLRTIEGETAQLICYERPDQTGTRTCSYYLAPVPDAEAMRALLAVALGVRGEVRKRRELLLWHNVRIHLDTVDGLGRFIEFEAVLGPEDDEATSIDRLHELIAALEIRDSDTLAGSYADMRS